MQVTEVRISCFTFPRPVRIKNWEDLRPLIFEDCHFNAGFRALGAKIDRGISFRNCSFHPLKNNLGDSGVALDFSNARLRGDLVLNNCEINGRLLAPGLKAKSDVQLYCCKINSELAEDPLLDLGQARIARNIDLRCSEIKGAISLYGANVGGYCDFSGLCCTDDLDLNFLTSSYFTAYRDKRNSNILCQRESLHVGRDLLLSGARIDFVDLRGAKIMRNLRARTGEFGVFIFGLGIKPSQNRFWPTRSLARAVSLTSVHVRETLDMCGIQVGEKYVEEYLDGKKEGFETDRYGLELLNSRIDGALVFFPDDNLTDLLRRQSGGTIEWQPLGVKTEFRHTGETSGSLSPKANEFPSQISGDLIIRACRIGGDLDLRNLHSCCGGIFLNNSTLGLNLKAGSRSETDEIVSDLATCCCHMDGEKLTCQGNVDLSGIRIETDKSTKAEALHEEDNERAYPNSEIRRRDVGSLYLRGAQIEGDLLLSHTRAPENDQSSTLGWIQGNLNLTGLRCEKLVLSGKNFVEPKNAHYEGRSGKWSIYLDTMNKERAKRIRPRAILTRGRFSQIEIHDWPVHKTWAYEWEIFKRFLREVFPWLGDMMFCLLTRPFIWIASIVTRLWTFISRKIRATSQPIDLRQIAVDNWSLTEVQTEESQGIERARHYVTVLREMDPEDRSTWLKVESDLRNKSFEWQADRVYLAMVWSSMRRRRKRWLIWRPLVFLWHLLVYLAQTIFLWVKVTFVVPLVVAILTFAGISLLFTDQTNVRATYGYLHAIPPVERSLAPDPNEVHPDDLGAKWNTSDAIALALRYHVPLFESRTHDRWEASENVIDSHLWIGKIHLTAKMETIVLAVEVTYWVVLPILLLGFVAWAFRKREMV